MQATRTSLLVKWSPPFLSDDGNDLKVRHYYIEYRMQEEFMAFSLVTAMGNETEKTFPTCNQIQNMQFVCLRAVLMAMEVNQMTLQQLLYAKVCIVCRFL